ncbi:hypothetical protein Tco_1458255 [Tanacetum coccineum]
MDRDHLDQLQADLAEARKKHQKRSDSPRTPSGSPLPLPPPPPPAPRASGASGSSQLPLPLLSSSFKPMDSDKSKQQTNDSGALDSTKPPVTTHQSSSWTISDTRDKPSGSSVYHLSPPNDQQLHDDSVPADEEHSSGDDDLGTVLKYCQKVGKTKLTQADFKGQAYEVVKAFYPDAVHLQFQMEECHKMLTDQIDWTNPQGDQVKIDINIPLPLSGPPGHVAI